MKIHPIPETGGRWSRDPKTGALTLIEEPTEYAAPEAASDPAPAAPAADPAPASRKTPAKADTEKDS